MKSEFLEMPIIPLENRKATPTYAYVLSKK